MSVTAVESREAHAAQHKAALTYGERLRNNRLGLWLFCFSELFLFGGFLMARFYLWRDVDTGAIVRPDLNQVLGLITTSVLLVSSLFMATARRSCAACWSPLSLGSSFSRALWDWSGAAS
jgi:cytochrome c oxidase subunit 3